MKKHFEVLDKLDSGTFGQVIKVKHQLANQLYAVKIISLPGNWNWTTNILLDQLKNN